MKRLISAIMMTVVMAGCSSKVKDMDNIYQFTVADNKGNEVCLDEYRGKVILVVNTATECGFTPQYTELDELYDTYRDKGFTILDFPCNQFGGQAPGTDAEIEEFCTLRFGTEFPRFHKIEVNGEGESPLYTWLKSKAGFAGFDPAHPLTGILDGMFRQQDPDYESRPEIKWNFTKFLIDRDGKVSARFEPTATKDALAPAIEAIL